MTKYQIPKQYSLVDLPEFKRYQANNPGKEIDEIDVINVEGRAIHWLSILEILWPPFEEVEYYGIEVKYIAYYDPDRSALPNEFYRQIALMLKTFWTIKLEDLYPDGDWTVQIVDDPEITVQATIKPKAR